MVMGDAPRSGIEIEPVRELALLSESTELFEPIAAAQSPVSAAGTIIEFEDLHGVAGIAQFKCSGQSGEAGAQDQDGRAANVALKLDATLVRRLRCQTESRHGMVHRRASSQRANEGEQIAATQGCIQSMLIRLLRTSARPSFAMDRTLKSEPGKYNRSFCGCYTLEPCARRPRARARSGPHTASCPSTQISGSGGSRRPANSTEFQLVMPGSKLKANICNKVLIDKGENSLVRSRGLEPPSNH
jgi:hypothetical protein